MFPWHHCPVVPPRYVWSCRPGTSMEKTWMQCRGAADNLLAGYPAQTTSPHGIIIDRFAPSAGQRGVAALLRRLPRRFEAGAVWARGG